MSYNGEAAQSNAASLGPASSETEPLLQHSIARETSAEGREDVEDGSHNKVLVCTTSSYLASQL